MKNTLLYLNSLSVKCSNFNKLDQFPIIIRVSFSNYEIESIFHTTDGGYNWTNVSGKLEVSNSDNKNIGPSVRYVNILNKGNTNLYFAGTSIGLFQTEELSSNSKWTQVSTDKIGNTIVNMVKTRQDGFIAVGTHGNGIFQAKFNTDPEPVFIPDDLSNEPDKLCIYPNPMKNNCRIEFPNKTNKAHRLIVIDATGRIVHIVENITQDNITINREQLKQGIHIINLQGEKIFKGKLLVK